MKTKIEIPIILEDQQKVINWSRKLRNKYIDFSTIIEFLVSDKKANSDIIDNGLPEARKIYQKYNSNWRRELLIALMIDNYRLENDIKEGQIVTNEKYIGYAFNIDYKTRDFALYSSLDEELAWWIGNFKLDDFKKV